LPFRREKTPFSKASAKVKSYFEMEKLFFEKNQKKRKKAKTWAIWRDQRGFMLLFPEDFEILEKLKPQLRKKALSPTNIP
jgi:hypothetical protein